jgi:hypothetical protein
MFTRKVFLILKAVDQKAGIKQLIIPIYSILFSPAKTDFKSFSQSIVFKELNKGIILLIGYGVGLDSFSF